MRRMLAIVAGIVAALLTPIATAQQRDTARWIETWGTSQQLVVPKHAPAPRPAKPPQQATPPASPMVPYPPEVRDQTIRMTARVSAGGPAIRLGFRNDIDAARVTFGSVHVALLADQRTGAIVPGSDRVVTFGGATSPVLVPGARLVSDPVALPVPPLARVAISVYVPEPTATATVHPLGLAPAYLAQGNVVGERELPGARLLRSYFWLDGVSVPAATATGAGTIVAFGDSITDGYATTPGTERDWPALLAARLQSRAATRGWSVVNAGISGNRILRTGAGMSALARFDADVLARPGVKWVILLEGINDINMSIIPGVPDTEHASAQEIIDGMAQLARRAHLHGIRIAAGTIMPTKGLPFYNATGEAMRTAVNRWIRESGTFDRVIDFDAAVRDPADPLRLRPAFDPGDHVHPNDAGNRAMAEAIDLRMFR